MIWDTKTNIHNPMFDRHGRVWFAARGRAAQKPGLLQEGLGPSVRQGVPAPSSRSRQLSMLDPKTMKYTFVDTCFQTHHLQFAYDANDTLWTSAAAAPAWSAGSTPKMFDETGDARSRRAGRR